MPSVVPAFRWERPTPSDVKSVVTELFIRLEPEEWFNLKLAKSLDVIFHQYQAKGILILDSSLSCSSLVYDRSFCERRAHFWSLL